MCSVASGCINGGCVVIGVMECFYADIQFFPGQTIVRLILDVLDTFVKNENKSSHNIGPRFNRFERI
jgi:hypothetical protein